MNRFRCFYTVLLGVSLFFASVNLFSQEIDQNYMFDYHDVSSMDYYLDLADRQSVEHKWHQYARFGINAALSEWEKNILLLMGEEFDLVPLREQVETEIDEVIESRFSKWMTDNFFSNMSPPLLGELSSEIEALNALYLYSPQADGSIKYKTTVGYDDINTEDPSGDSELVIKGEKTLWTEGVKTKIDELLEVWSEKMITAFSELRFSVEENEIKNMLESAYDRDFDSYRNEFKRQLYRLYNLEQSRFTELRLYDRTSLQYQSETETAAFITDNLITQTRAELDSGLEVLVSGLNAEVDEVITDGGIVNADEWQESFHNLLEHGLSSWDAAEEELLMERVQWEQVSGREIVEGEKVWAEAFNQLLEKRSEWISEFRATLEEGNLLWAKESFELESAIEKAVAGIDESIADSEDSLQGRMDNLVGMLLQSVNMMRTARTSWEYWMDQFDEGEKGSFDSGDVEFDTEAMQLSMLGIKPGLSELQRNENAAYNEAVYWTEVFHNYQQYAVDSQSQLAETYGIIVFDNPSLHTAFDGEQLSGALFDDSILFDEAAWEAVYLDEFQVELLKARAYMQYWEKQKEIAQAVYNYAADKSSNKEAARITMSRLEQAKADYETELESYSDHLDKLSNISTQLGVLQQDMQTIQTEIEDYQRQLSSAREEYNQMITDLQVDNPQYLADQYRAFYIELLESLGMKDGTGNKTGSAFEEYLLAAVEYGFEHEIALVSQRVIKLLSGGNNTDIADIYFNPETASLNELHQRAVISGEAGFSSDTGEVGNGLFNLSSGSRLNAFTEYLKDNLLLSTEDYRYGQLINYYEQYHNPGSQEAGTILWEMQRLVRDISIQAEADYELRLAEIRLYTSSDFSSWSQRYFSTDDFNEIISITNDKDFASVIEAIDDDIAVYNEIISLYDINAVSEGVLIYNWSTEDINNPALLNKYQAFQKIWDYRRSGHDNDVETAAEITGIIDSLTSLRHWLDSIESLQQRTAELEQAILSPNPAEGQNYLSSYLDGGHTLYSESGDLHSYLYTDKCSTAALEISISNMLKERGFNAPVLKALNHENSKNELISLLAEEHLIDIDTLVFFSPAEVWDAADFADTSEIVEWLINFDIKTSKLNLPQYLSEILSGFISELKDYSAVRAAEVFTDEIDLDFTSLNAAIREQSNRISELNSMFQTLQKHNDDVVKLMNIAAANSIPDELKAEAQRRLLDTAGFDLAVSAVETPDFVNSLNDWGSLFDLYISKIGVSPLIANELEIYHSAMLERAVELYELAIALETPEETNWSSAPSDWLDTYKAMLWNSMEFTAAAELLSGENSSVNFSVLEELKIIDEFMPDSEAEFPEDVELEWLYRGNEIRRYADQQIIAGIPDLWADENFNIENEVLSRILTDEELAGIDEELILSAAEIAQGVTFKQKAEAVWDSSFRIFTESNLFEDSLKILSGLLLLDNYMEINGGYSSDYGYDEFLDELCEGLEFYDGVVFEPAAALNSLLEQNGLENENNLSGESLYWNLLWRARQDAVKAGYNQTDTRNSIIFNNDSDLEVIDRWISQTEADYDVYSAKIESILAGQGVDVISLASTAAGAVYSEITAYVTVADLIENNSYEVESAIDLINWFLELKNINYSLETSSLLEYLTCPVGDRLLHILNNHTDAAVHYLKKQIISGSNDNDKLAADIGKLTNLSMEQKEQLNSILSDSNYITVYKPTLHGNFEEYLDSKYEDSAQKRKQREIYSRFPGTPLFQWDDPVFYAAIIEPGLDTFSILENLAFNRTRGTNISGLNPQSGMSTNDVFINESLQKMG